MTAVLAGGSAPRAQWSLRCALCERGDHRAWVAVSSVRPRAFTVVAARGDCRVCALRRAINLLPLAGQPLARGWLTRQQLFKQLQVQQLLLYYYIYTKYID